MVHGMKDEEVEEIFALTGLGIGDQDAAAAAARMDDGSPVSPLLHASPEYSGLGDGREWERVPLRGSTPRRDRVGHAEEHQAAGSASSSLAKLAAALTAELEGCRAENAELASQNTALTARVRGLVKKIDTLESQLAETSGMHLHVSAQVSLLNDRALQLQSKRDAEHAQLTDKLRRQCAEADAAKAKVRDLSAELERLLPERERVHALQQEVGDLKRRLQQSEEELEEKKKQLLGSPLNSLRGGLDGDVPAQHAQMSSLDQEACEVIYDFHNARLVAHDIASPLHASRNGSIIQPRFSPRSSPAKQTPAPPSHATSTNNRTEQERTDSRAAGAGEALVDQQVPDGVDAGARGHASVGAHNKHGAIATEGFESGGMKQEESPSAVAMRIAKKVVERQQEEALADQQVSDGRTLSARSHTSSTNNQTEPERANSRQVPGERTPAAPSHTSGTNNRTEQERANSMAAGAGEALADQQVPDGRSSAKFRRFCLPPCLFMRSFHTPLGGQFWPYFL